MTVPIWMTGCQGFRRLSFVDLEGGSQPIYNETRDMVITFNGEDL